MRSPIQSTGREGAFFGYVAAVGVAAVTVSAPYLADLPAFLHRAPAGFWLVAALAVLCAAGPFEFGAVPVFPAVCFVMAALLNWGIGPAVLVQAAAVAVATARLARRPYRAAFDTGRCALALVAAHLFGPLAAVLFGPLAAVLLGPLAAVLFGPLAAVPGYFAVDAVLLGVAGWLRRGSRRPADEVLATGAVLLLGVLVARAGYLAPLVLVPLYAVGRMARLAGQRDRYLRLDPLTGLLGRPALAAEVAARTRTHQRFAVFLLDLDRFRRVNSALGHEAGDRLLAAVGRRLRDTALPGEIVARLGGDEFAVLSPGPTGDAGRRAARLAGVLAEPVVLDGLPLDVSGAVGVARYPQHGADPATLLRHAEIAMYDAKSRGDAVAVYAPDADHSSPDRLSLIADLRRALADPDGDEIAFHYQPQVDIDSGAVIGVEALLRWRHPRRGPVDPGELIRIAEYSSVMRLLSRRVIDDVVAQLGRWASAGVRLRASINVSVRDLLTTEVADWLADRLRYHDVGADQVQLEITEGALMVDPRRVLATLRRLDALGVALSLDDFGTGYSSMQHLRRLPLAEVKIDRSFVAGMVGDPDDEAIVRSIIELAGALGLRAVAEGVEDECTYRMLATSGCHAAQGWYHGRPMPADELLPWLSRRAAGAARAVS